MLTKTIVDRRRNLCRLFYWFCGLLFLAFLGVNILLNSPLVRGRIENVLEEKTGEEWSIAAVNYTLRGNIVIHDLAAEIDDGEIQVDRIKLTPNYPRLWHRDLRLKSIEVESPVCILTDAWLMQKMHAQPVVEPVVEGPVVAQNATQENRPNNQSDTEMPNPPQTGSESDAKNDPPEIAARQIDILPKNGAEESHSRIEEDELEEWLYLKDAQFIFKTKKGNLIELDKVFAELPIGGKDLVGSVKWDAVRVLNKEVIPKGVFNIEKKGHLLSVKETAVDFFGMALEPDVYMAKSSTGLWCQLDLKLPEQSASELFSHLDLTMEASIKSVAGRLYFLGDLTKPMSWRSLAELRALEVKAVEGHRNTTFEFDSVVVQQSLSRGVMRIPQLAMHGEDVSVMSNGVLAANGYGFGVVRVVASEEMANWIDSVHQGARLVEGVPWHIMRPMGNEDRYSMDVRFDGVLTEPMMKVEHVSAWQPLLPAVQRLRDFVQSERLEDIRQGL